MNQMMKFKVLRLFEFLVERGTTKECEGKEVCFNSASKDIFIQGYWISHYVEHFIIYNDRTVAMIFLSHS